MSILESFLTYMAVGMGLVILSLTLDPGNRKWADRMSDQNGIMFIVVTAIISTLIWPVGLGFEVRRYYGMWRQRH